MSTTPVVTEKPIEITLGDGSKIVGANLEEAIKNAAKRVEDNSAAYRSEKQLREAAETELARLREQVKPEPVIDGKFNKERYYQMLNDDPIAAQNYMDQYRFGVADPVAAINGMREQVDVITQQSVVAAFSAIHAEDFPATPDAAKALRQRTEQLVNNGFPFNLDTVNYAYNQAVSDGSIKPLEKRTSDTTEIPPTLSGSGSSGLESDVARAETMSDEDLKKLMRSKGMMV